MIGWLGGRKPDHPMGDIKEAKRILSELPSGDTFKCVDEIADWIESVMRTEGFRLDHRIEVIRLLDETAQVHQRRLTREYLSTPRLPKFRENRLWTTLFNLWRQLAGAYDQCIADYRNGVKGASDAKAEMPLATCRAMRALLAQLKWQQMRYGPIDNGIWRSLGTLYEHAEARGFRHTVVQLYPGIPSETTVEQEFLKTLVVWISAPDGLVPLHIEIAERITAHFAPAFVIEQPPRVSGTHCFDLALARPPLRLLGAGAIATPSMRYFSAGQALRGLEDLIQHVQKGVLPESVNLGATYKPTLVHEVLEHLIAHWSPAPPARRHERHQVMARLSVINGFEPLLETFDQSALSFSSEAAESWIVDNISAGGFGAVIPQIRSEWIRVGGLLGIRPEGVQTWGVGVIRRFARDDQQQGHVGVQTLAKSASAVRVRPVDVKVAGSHADDEGYRPAILLQTGAAGEATLVLTPGTYSPTNSFEMMSGERMHLLIPIRLVEKGDDFDIARFRRMERDQDEAASA